MKEVILWAVSNLAWSVLVYVVMRLRIKVSTSYVPAIVSLGVIIGMATATGYFILSPYASATIKELFLGENWYAATWGCICLLFLTVITIWFNIPTIANQNGLLALRLL